MPRKPRFCLAGIPNHVIQRGNSRQPVFLAEDDCRTYLQWLAEATRRWPCVVHAYVLMTNHVHLLITPADSVAVSRSMQYLGRRYVPYFNQKYRRSGTLWEGRFKSSLVQSERYLLACYRYIEMNPVRARMVPTPGDYRWSSYRANALGDADSIITPHAQYLALGSDESARAETYRSLCEPNLETSLLKQVRECVQTGTPLGDTSFREHIERTLGRKVGFAARGRPRKPRPSDD